MSPTRAVLFDLGGTLFSYASVVRWSRDAVLGGARRLGVGPSREVGRAYRDASRAATLAYADRPYYLHRDLFSETYRLFARELGREASEADVAWFASALRTGINDNVELRDDCLTTLRTLRDRGLYVAIVSNIDDDQLHPIVERTGLDAVLHDWTSSETARSCKPDPRFFELALEKAGCAAAETLFVGDSPEHDILGASAVGMRTVLIVEGDEPAPLQSGRETPDPDHEVRALAELIALV